MIMHFFELFTGVDHSSEIGRIDREALPQQALMELFVQGINEENSQKLGFHSGNSVSNWFGIHLNENTEIIIINWFWLVMSGTIDLQWLPLTVKSLSITMTDISGPVDLTCLPPPMETLTLVNNVLSGTLDLEYLHKSLKTLELDRNEFNGEISLTGLPESLELLDVSQNKLSGSLDFTNLPKSMTKLNLSINAFAGVADFTELPPTLEKLNLSTTRLEGEIYCAREEKDKFRVAMSRVIVHCQE